MTTLRNSFFKLLYKETAFQLFSINQRHPTKKCPDNKIMHLSLNCFLYINQSVKRYQNPPNNILQGRLDNNYYEADRPYNWAVMHSGRYGRTFS